MTDSKIKIKPSTKKREDRLAITKVTFDPLQVEIKTTDTVVLLLKSDEEQVVLRAVAALDKFVSKSADNLQSLCEMTSIMDTLLPLTSHSQLYIRRFSLKILAQMCALKPAREKLLEDLEHLPYFVQVLTKEDDHFMQEFSALILAELTSHNIACARIVDTNVLDTLFDRIASKDPDIQKNSIQLMANMLRDPTTLEAFSSCKEFKFEPILSLLKSEYPVIQALAVTVLEGLTRRRHDQLMQELFRQSGGLEQLLDILEMLEWKELHKGVLNILLNCAEGPLTAQYLHSSGGLGKLLQYMEIMPEPDLVEGALGVVARLANTELGRDMLHKNNIEKELCQLLREDNSQVTGAACLGIALMTHNRHALAVIVKENPVKDLLLCLKNESRPWKSRQSAAHALCELLRVDKKMSITLLENKQDFLVPLFHQLFGKMPVELSITLVHCLIALSIHEDIRVKLLESKLLEALLACLQEGTEADVELKIAAIHCLCGYICESQARDWFLNLGGVNKIVQCLMNTSVPLRQAAATFLQLAAREPPIAAAFIHAGMLHWMLDQKTMHRAIPIWETAIEALFSNYLPAKFAYMGRLDMTDVTEEGFYVTRHAERIFPILEELLVARLCPLRPIYVCNFRSMTPALNPSVGMGAKPVRRRARSSSISGSKRPGTNLKMSEVNSTNVNTTQEEFDALMTASAFDPYLGNYLEQLQSILTTNGTLQQSADVKSMRDRIKVVAQFVAAQMSGPDPHRKCDVHQLELHLNEIKVELCNNVIPIGHIRVGSYLERALLFKILADRVGLPCALVRGKYSRAWIEVAIPQEERGQDEGGDKPAVPLRLLRPNFIVDLMNNVGELLLLHSYEGDMYCGKPV